MDTYISTVKEHSSKVDPEDLIRVIWKVMIKAVNMVGKNQMQLLQMIVRSLKSNKLLIEENTKSMKQELALLNCVQVTCYEDSKLLKVRHIPHNMCNLIMVGSSVLYGFACVYVVTVCPCAGNRTVVCEPSTLPRLFFCADLCRPGEALV